MSTRYIDQPRRKRSSSPLQSCDTQSFSRIPKVLQVLSLTLFRLCFYNSFVFCCCCCWENELEIVVLNTSSLQTGHDVFFSQVSQRLVGVIEFLFLFCLLLRIGYFFPIFCRTFYNICTILFVCIRVCAIGITLFSFHFVVNMLKRYRDVKLHEQNIKFPCLSFTKQL